jgi:hypothetical protein
VTDDPPSSPSAIAGSRRVEATGTVMRDYESIAARFRANGYPPPHRLATLLPDYNLQISGARDVVEPVVTRRHTGEIVDGVNRAQELIESGVLWADVPKIEVDLPTDEDVAAHIHKLNLERRHLTASQAAVATVLLGLGEPHKGARTDLRQNCRKSSPVSAKYLQYARRHQTAHKKQGTPLPRAPRHRASG